MFCYLFSSVKNQTEVLPKLIYNRRIRSRKGWPREPSFRRVGTGSRRRAKRLLFRETVAIVVKLKYYSI